MFDNQVQIGVITYGDSNFTRSAIEAEKAKGRVVVLRDGYATIHEGE